MGVVELDAMVVATVLMGLVTVLTDVQDVVDDGVVTGNMVGVSERADSS